MTTITPCLWFDGQAEEAARFYSSVIPGSRVDKVERSAVDYPAGKAGDVLLVLFTLAGAPYQALNGGSTYRFTPAVSLSVSCADQAEVDRIWDALLADGGAPMACGWLTDRYGLSWQIVPAAFERLMRSGDKAGIARAMTAMMGMIKLDEAALRRAFEGGEDAR